MNVFNINKGDSDDEDSDRELDDEEHDILKQFEENDKELEDIASRIVGELDKLKGKSENI